MSDDWEEFVGIAFVAALALFAYLFIKFLGDFSTVSSTSDSLSNFFLAVGYSLAPQGLALYIDLAAAALTGIVSINVLRENVIVGLFVALSLYFFISILGNYFMVVG